MRLTASLTRCIARMALPWFRFYDEVVNDPKVQLLAAPLFKAWINFLCIANKHSDRGALPELEQIAYRLRVTKPRAEMMLNQLVLAGLFEWKDGVCRAHNWRGRQFQSDATTERVKQWRQQQRNVSVTVDATPQIQNRDRTETEQTPPNPQNGQARYSGEFEEFWAAYPRKAAKGDAWKAWRKLKPNSELRATILVAIERHKLTDDWQRQLGKFIPYPASWLNSKRWEDGIASIDNKKLSPATRLGYHVCQFCDESHDWECGNPDCGDSYFLACKKAAGAFA